MSLNAARMSVNLPGHRQELSTPYLFRFDVVFRREHEIVRKPVSVDVSAGLNDSENDIPRFSNLIQFRTLVHMFHLLGYYIRIMSASLSEPLQHLELTLKDRRIVHNSSAHFNPCVGHERP